MPPNTPLLIPEDLISSKIWKRKEKTSLSISSIFFYIPGVFILNKLKRFWSLSRSFQQVNPPKIPKSTKRCLKRSSIFLNHFGDVRQHCLWHCWQLCWSLVQHKAQFWVPCSSLSLRLWVDGWDIRWPITDIHCSWNTEG